jgi:hypothetical protein
MLKPLVFPWNSVCPATFLREKTIGLLIGGGRSFRCFLEQRNIEGCFGGCLRRGYIHFKSFV